MSRTTFTRSFAALAAALAISAALAAPATGHAAGEGGRGQGKVHVHDISMSVQVARSVHPGGANFLMADGSVRFNPYGGFQGGVVVAAGDVDSTTGRITGVSVDPGAGPGTSTGEDWTVIVVTDHGATAAGVSDRSTDLVIDPFNR